MVSDRKINLRKCMSVACSEYTKVICNPRMTILPVLFVLIYDYVIKELVSEANLIGTKINVVEPFVAISNSYMLMLIIPVVYMAIMGDFPRVDGNSIYYLMRTGRRNWLLGQLFFCIISSVTYVLNIFFVSTILTLGKSVISNKWSYVVSSFIDGRIYNNLKPMYAATVSILMMILYLILISMMLMMGFLYGKRAAGIALTASLMCIGTVLVSIGSNIKWLFPQAHTLVWLHYDEVYNTHLFDMRYSFVYMIVLIVLMYVLNEALILNYDFTSMSDVEG